MTGTKTRKVTLNLTSFLANKCFEYLLKYDSDQGAGQSSYSSQKPILPPWAKDLKEFNLLCNGCGDCISACGNSILILNKDGVPLVDFARGSCSFCGACAESCNRDAFQYEPAKPPWNLFAHINSNCLINNNVICSTCVEQCDKEAISLPRIIDKNKTPMVMADACNGCGACLKACPVNAIEIGRPENQEQP